MVIRHLEIISDMATMFDPRAPTLAAVEEERKTLCNEGVLNDMRENAKKKRAPLSRNEPRPV